MLDLISDLKSRNWGTVLDHTDINDVLLNMHHLKFLPRANIKFKSPITIETIVEPDILEKYAEMTMSCMFRTSGPEQREAYLKFLTDPGALYFSVENEKHIGYIRFYAGKLVKGNEEVLFEDNMRTRTKESLVENIFQFEFKAVGAKILEELGLTEEGYLFVPEITGDSYLGQSLVLNKLGSTYFKKGFNPNFYVGELEPETDPFFERASVLLE
jgi:hypothetical protein